MKRYVCPREEIIPLHLKQIIAESQTEQSVYTDDPVDPGNALVKEQQKKNIWDNEW